MKKVCVVTGSRAEYGLLRNLIGKIQDDQEMYLLLCVTGSHLSKAQGFTYQEIEADGYEINEKVDLALGSDDPAGIAKSMALALTGFSSIFTYHKPDLLVLLGDRYEMLAVASAATVCRIPIAHLHGGEATYGAIDEAIRHSITKMSYLHFTSTEPYRRRVIQLGEAPGRVFNVGAIGVENVLNMDFITKENLEKDLNISLDQKIILATYHPVTLEENTAEQQFSNLLDSLRNFSNLRVIFTKANADTNGSVINQMIDTYVMENPNRAVSFPSLGARRYLSLLQYADAVVGNSSSGIIEVPSYKIPTVNIGDRQKGRIQAATIINCGTGRQEITAAIEAALSDEFRKNCIGAVNPYEGIDTCNQIFQRIKEFLIHDRIDIKKSFYDVSYQDKPFYDI